MANKLEFELFQLFENLKRQVNSKPLFLGGITGGVGGQGGPPAGFIGQLPQNRVTFDIDELESLDIPGTGVALPSGRSLVTNLNRIRYRIGQLETSGTGSIIQENDVVVASGVTILNFEGGATVVDEGAGKATITVTASGGGLSSVEIREGGADKGDATVLDFNSSEFNVTVVSGVADISLESAVNHIYNEDMSSQYVVTVAPEYHSDFSRIQNTAQTSSTFSVTIPDEADLGLFVGVGMRGGISVTSMTFNGSPLSLVAAVQPGGDVRGEMWKMVAPDVGTYDLVINVSSAQVINAAGVILTGVNQSSPIAASASANGTNNNPTVLVTSAVGTLLLDIYADQASTSLPSPGETEQTEIVDLTGTYSDMAMSYRPRQGASTQMSWNLNSSDVWTHIGAAINGIQTQNQTFNTDFVYASGTLRVYYNGLRQAPSEYVDGLLFDRFTTLFSPSGVDTLYVDYDYLESAQVVASGWGIILWGGVWGG